MLLASKLQLVPEIRKPAIRKLLSGNERARSGVVGRRNAEDSRDELGVPLRDAIDDGAAPVVAAENDSGGVCLAGDGGYGVGVGEEGVVFQVGREALHSGLISYNCCEAFRRNC